MAKKTKSDAKDSATKNTMNAPGKHQEPVPHAGESADRDVGQFTETGQPPNQKR
jgi:hypothetical protein